MLPVRIRTHMVTHHLIFPALSIFVSLCSVLALLHKINDLPGDWCVAAVFFFFLSFSGTFVALCLLCTRVRAACVSVYCACICGNTNLHLPLVVCTCVRSVHFVLTKACAWSHSGGLRILFLPFWHTALPINYWHIPIFSFHSHLSLCLRHSTPPPAQQHADT